MPKRELHKNVMDAAVERMERLYREGHEVVVSFSGGKDSGACVEICKIAASRTDRLPVKVVMRDEEIMFPGTFEYAEQVAKDPNVEFHWMYARQPVINCFNRESPYFWVFDENLHPDEWVRKPPDYTGALDGVPNAYCYEIEEQHIGGMTTPERFPPEEAPAGEDAELFTVIGLRVNESEGRRLGLYASGGYLTKETDWGFRKCRPIYDWTDGDIWRAYREFDWDYNEAYNTMNRLGVSKTELRIAPPTLSPAGVDQLDVARRAWPKWWERVCNRLDGVETAGQFGRDSVEPIRRVGETWKECFHRACIDEAPDWIAERAKTARDHRLGIHRNHSTAPLPQRDGCSRCAPTDSWKKLARVMYMGDPFAMKQNAVDAVEPEFFREGAGTWGGGDPTF